jgi:hypothetical protein
MKILWLMDRTVRADLTAFPMLADSPCCRVDPCDHPDLATPTSAAGQARYQDVLAAENEKGLVYLEKIAGSFALATKIQCSVAPGNPAEVIVDKRLRIANLDRHDHPWPIGDQSWLIGSVADKVLRRANPPAAGALVKRLRCRGNAAWQRMIVPRRLAFGREGDSHAAELARPLGLEVVLMRCLRRAHAGVRGRLWLLMSKSCGLSSKMKRRNI